MSERRNSGIMNRLLPRHTALRLGLATALVLGPTSACGGGDGSEVKAQPSISVESSPGTTALDASPSEDPGSECLTTEGVTPQDRINTMLKNNLLNCDTDTVLHLPDNVPHSKEVYHALNYELARLAVDEVCQDSARLGNALMRLEQMSTDYNNDPEGLDVQREATTSVALCLQENYEAESESGATTLAKQLRTDIAHLQTATSPQIFTTNHKYPNLRPYHYLHDTFWRIVKKYDETQDTSASDTITHDATADYHPADDLHAKIDQEADKAFQAAA